MGTWRLVKVASSAATEWPIRDSMAMAEDMAQTVIALYGDCVEQRYPTTNGLLQRTVSCNEIRGNPCPSAVLTLRWRIRYHNAT